MGYPMGILNIMKIEWDKHVYKLCKKVPPFEPQKKWVVDVGKWQKAPIDIIKSIIK